MPEVLSKQEVMRLLEVVENPKHRAIMLLTYSAGLRPGEVVRLRVEDIDRERCLIHVRQGIPLRPIYWSQAQTFDTFKNYLGTKVPRPQRFTRM